MRQMATCVLTGSDTMSDGQPLYNGLYLVADTPKKLHPLAVEDGDGDKLLLIEAVKEHLTLEEQQNLVTHLPELEENQ